MFNFSMDDMPTSPGSKEEGSDGGKNIKTNTADNKQSVLTSKPQSVHSDNSEGNSSPKSHITASP